MKRGSGTVCTRCGFAKNRREYDKTNSGHYKQECKVCVEDRRMKRVPKLTGDAALFRKWTIRAW